MARKETAEMTLSGINASAGICIGKAYLVDQEGVDVIPTYVIAKKDSPQEIKRFKSAVKKADDELRTIIDGSPNELKDTHILETHLVILKDKMLYGKTIETIETETVNAEWALKKVVSNLKSAFRGMADSYLKERAADIVQVSDRIMRNLTGTSHEDIAAINKRVILVARDLSPAETSQINLERVMGFVTDRGGKASHTGIIAQTLEIPAVVGLGVATARIKSDDIVVVDGNTGKVIVNPSDETLIAYEERKEQYEAFRAELTRESTSEAITRDGNRIEVMGNIELPEEVVSVRNYGADGIGLYRTEFQYLSRSGFPTEAELFDSYRDVIEVISPKPVTIRTLDINGDKALANHNGVHETNPALGLRAIRYCLRKPEVFNTQLRAILRAAVHGNVRIIFPMISACFEINRAIEFLDRAAEELEKEGLPYNRDIPVGIMIEVPSAVFMAAELARRVDFFSIGTNDLIQYSLAIDRGNRLVAHLYQPLDPAVVRMIKHVCDAGHENGIGVYMCGEMAGSHRYTPLLLGLGLDELSMNPQAIPLVKRMIKSLTLSETRTLIDGALKKTTAWGVYDLLREAYGDLMTEQLYPEK
jgi:phosphotransferase system enzyme I (PtsI)